MIIKWDPKIPRKKRPEVPWQLYLPSTLSSPSSVEQLGAAPSPCSLVSSTASGRNRQRGTGGQGGTKQPESSQGTDRIVLTNRELTSSPSSLYGTEVPNTILWEEILGLGGPRSLVFSWLQWSEKHLLQMKPGVLAHIKKPSTLEIKSDLYVCQVLGQSRLNHKKLSWEGNPTIIVITITVWKNPRLWAKEVSHQQNVCLACSWPVPSNEKQQ